MPVRKHLTAYLFISPWLLGLFIFTLGPMVISLYLSFTTYDLFSPPSWVGLGNYTELFGADERFYQSLKVTFLFAFLSVPIKLLVSLLVAMLLSRGIRGIGLYRSIFYLPSMIGGSVAIAVVWQKIFGDNGLVNMLLLQFGVKGPIWISNPDYAIYTLILLAIWQFGSPMVIFLAGLKQIPDHLYEASSIDGANKFRQFISITVPMLTPIIFFNLVMQTIGSFLSFTQGFIITKGGPLDSTLFYAIYLYERGFTFLYMGYASALAWILLIIVALMTALIFSTSRKWVYYESGEGNR